MTQRMQVVAQNNIVSAALKPGNQPLKVPLVVRLITGGALAAGRHGPVCGARRAARARAVRGHRQAMSGSVRCAILKL